MSKTPQFDQKLEQRLAETKPGERICPLTQEKWQLEQEEEDCPRTGRQEVKKRQRFFHSQALQAQNTPAYAYQYNEYQKLVRV